MLTEAELQSGKSELATIAVKSVDLDQPPAVWTPSTKQLFPIKKGVIGGIPLSASQETLRP